MGNCSECGKTLRFFEGCAHPLRGKKYLICINCFNRITKSIEYYNRCLFLGRENHKKDCYFWDAEKKRCRNEKFINKRKKRIPNQYDKKGGKNVIKNTYAS